MYLKMLVGSYQGEIRGPFDILTGRHLVASNQAIKAEYDPESGEFRVPEDVQLESSEDGNSATTQSAEPSQPNHKKGRR